MRMRSVRVLTFCLTAADPCCGDWPSGSLARRVGADQNDVATRQLVAVAGRGWRARRRAVALASQRTVVVKAADLQER